MQLLHNKSITECRKLDDCLIHAKESNMIINKIKEMENYDCSLRIKETKTLKNGFKENDISSGECKLHDIPRAFIDLSVLGYDFAIDLNNLVMIVYRSIPDDPIQKTTTIFINPTLMKEDKQSYNLSIADDFLELMHLN